jgi:hypothetical protein
VPGSTTPTGTSPSTVPVNPPPPSDMGAGTSTQPSSTSKPPTTPR